jgi:alginate O-acetyltransferase complex protein AlgI
LIFSSAPFLAFFAFVVPVAWLLPARARKLFLLAASYYFYASWDWRFLGLIVLSTAIDFAAGLVMARWSDPRVRRSALVASLVTNLGILGVFKYAGFFLDSFAALAASAGIELGPLDLRIVLPVGISFFTFQSMSYTIDLYRRQIDTCRDPFDFALFVGFFPQLVAGPIVRARDFLPQLLHRPAWSTLRFLEGLERIALGLAKKVVVADTLALLVDPVFADPQGHGLFATWLAVLGFTAQIYADFSGYSDVAIGAARCLGYELPENFRHPYLATSPREFWRRWHISLSTWLRDYLFIPLGGSRGTPGATRRNLLITMLLGGLWHGAAWTFVTWGAWHGAWLALHRRLVDHGASPRTPLWLRRTGTLLGVMLGWVLFRAASFGDAFTLLGGLAGAHGLLAEADEFLRWRAAWVLLVPAATHALAAFEERRRGWSRPLWLRSTLVTGALVGILTFWPEMPRAFIYFQF